MATFDDLIAYAEKRDAELEEWNAWRRKTEAEVKRLDKLISAGKSYLKNKPIVDEFRNIKFTKRREAYKAAHDTEISAFYSAERKLSGCFDGHGELPIEDWETQRIEIGAKHEKAETVYSRLYQESMELLKIQKCIEDIRHQQGRTQQKQHHYER